MNHEVKDFLGHTLKVGSVIVYGHLLSRCVALKAGKVLKISFTEVPYQVWTSTTRNYVPGVRYEYKIIVQGVETDRNRQLKLCRKGCLQYPDRCMVVDPLALPADVKALLDTVK